MYGLHEYYIQQAPKKRSFWKEIRTFVFFFVAIFVGVLVFTNINLFASSFRGLFAQEIQPLVAISTSMVSQDNSIASVVDTAEKDSAVVASLLKTYQNDADVNALAPSTEEILQSHLMDYNFAFNTVAPVNRILVPSIGLDVPIIISKNKSATDFSKADYDEELKEGVVKYPTTPAPGQEGNTLLFGHTSQEVWKSNPFGTIFKDIAKLKDSTLIQILREGHLYEYKVIDVFVVLPQQVNAQYMTYQNAGGSYITLLGCYPLGTAKKRIMVVAKLITK